VTAPLFLVEPAAIDDDVIVLDGPEGRHAAVVVRLRAGERVDVSDGLGSLLECEVASVASMSLRLNVLTRTKVAPPAPRLVVVQALPKGDRGETACEVLTEVGVDEIVPWSADRSIVEWRGARGDKALDRWRSTARAAAKQSRRAWLPVISPLATTAEVAERLRAATLGVVLHESATTPLAGLDVPAAGEIVVVIGPEGSITDGELAVFASAGAAAYRLGSSILRTSTAGVVAAAVLLAKSRWMM
jgi:16S rRNA (uracil1498-N3)-methyltransferase